MRERDEMSDALVWKCILCAPWTLRLTKRRRQSRIAGMAKYFGGQVEEVEEEVGVEMEVEVEEAEVDDDAFMA